MTNWVEVTSSNIASVAYENSILLIKFNSGDVYAYQGVPKSVYDGLLTAESIGSYFHSQVRKPGYSFDQLI
ncbi:KTSC domain-containing protein [Planctomycetota bacterium]|nr:KTSC domain-containing protein [Planctomycetota bacterium]